MAQSPSGDGDGDGVDVCRQANEAALAKGLSFCETPTARVKTLSRMVGLDSDEIDADEILGIDPNDQTIDVRKRVLARTEEIIDGGGTDQPLDAINEAWNDVGADFTGTEPEPEPDEEEEEEEPELDLETDEAEEAGPEEADADADEDEETEDGDLSDLEEPVLDDE